MLSQLNQPLGVGRYRIRLPKAVYVQNGLTENLLRQRRHYQNRIQRVDNRHLLVRLIQNSPLPYKSDARPFLDAAKDLLYELASAFKLTSNVSVGEVHHPGVFYGTGVYEAISLHDEPFDVYQDWRTLSPIRILNHPVSGTHLQLPDGSDRQANGYATIAINYPMLMWVYRHWRLDESVSMVDDSHLSVGHFVHMHLLPGCLEDHLDGVIFNRLYNDLLVFEDTGGDEAGSMHLIDYSEALDGVLAGYMDRLERETLSVEELIASVPVVGHETLYETLRLPDLIVNQQTRWWCWMAQVPVLKWVVVYQYLTGSRRDVSFERDTERLLRRTLRGRWIPNGLERVESHLESEFELIREWLAA